jgi:hypothetical protein
VERPVPARPALAERIVERSQYLLNNVPDRQCVGRVRSEQCGQLNSKSSEDLSRSRSRKCHIEPVREVVVSG